MADWGFCEKNTGAGGSGKIEIEGHCRAQKNFSYPCTHLNGIALMGLWDVRVVFVVLSCLMGSGI